MRSIEILILPGIKAVLFALLLLIFFHKTTIAAVVINEFSSASNPEWVELYNPDDQIFSLSSVTLLFDDKTDTTQKLSFCTADEIGGKSFKLITRAQDSYWLADSGDTLIIKKEDDVIDSISYGSSQPLKAPSKTQSAGRSPDGSSSWVIITQPTPQGDAANFSCPTPTPTPSPTSSPTSTPTPQATATPTSTPTPAKTPTPPPTSTPTKTPTPTPTKLVTPTTTLSPTAGNILGISSIQGDSQEASPSTQQKNGLKPLIITFLFIGAGLALIALVLVWQKRNVVKRVY